MKKSTLAIVLALAWGFMAACGAAAKDGVRDEVADSRVLQQEERSDTVTSEEETQSQEVVEKPSGYFDNLSSYYTAGEYVMQGSVKNRNREKSILITDVVAKEDAQIRITGCMECAGGAAQIIYVAPDGTESVLVEADTVQIDVAAEIFEGSGYICYTGVTEDFCYNFVLNFELSNAVSYSEADLEDMEDGNGSMADGMEDMVADLGGILAGTGNNMGYSGNWKTGLGREDENFTAEDWSLLLSLDEPAVLEIESVTVSGNLDIRILFSDGSAYYSVEGVGTGCSYVGLDQRGTYVISIWAKEHNGSFSFRLDPIDIDEKLEKLTAHLPFIKDMKTEEGKKVVWGIDELGKAEIEGKDCYLLDLRYADEEENGVMVGRRLGSYAFSQDGEQYYELNVADDSWNRI